MKYYSISYTNNGLDIKHIFRIDDARYDIDSQVINSYIRLNGGVFRSFRSISYNPSKHFILHVMTDNLYNKILEANNRKHA